MNDDTRLASHLAHRCATILPELQGEDGTHLMIRLGGRGCPVQDTKISSKLAGTKLAHMGHNNNPEYTNTHKAYLTMDYT